MKPLEFKEFARNAARWDSQPWVFGKELFGTTYDPGQMKLLRDWADPEIPRVGVVGATGTGKTRIFAEMVLHFLCCKGGSNPFLHPKGLATAIDGKNLEMNLWPELAKLILSSPLKELLKWQSEKVFMKHAPATWFFEKRTWDAKSTSDPNSPTGSLGLAGHHSINSLFLIDESSGVPMSVLQAAERTLSTHKKGEGFIKILQGGNPTHKSGPLYASATKLKKLWNGGKGPVKMTGDPDDPERCPRIDIEWARAQIESLGKDDPFVQVYILAEFPDSDFNSFLGIDDVDAAMARDVPYNAYAEFFPYSGLDVAYGGDDSSVLTHRQGLKCWPQEKLNVPLSDPQIGFNMASMIQTRMAEIKSKFLFVDATGGYAGAVMEASRIRGVNPIAIKFNAKASDKFFYNKRTELHWKAAQWVKRGGCLPNDEQLREEAVATRYTIKKDQMICEPKDIVKTRLGRSPDKWDSFITTFEFDDRQWEPGGQAVGGGMKSCMDINPFEEYSKRKVTNPATSGGFSNPFSQWR